jgi:hypothetical protein
MCSSLVYRHRGKGANMLLLFAVGLVPVVCWTWHRAHPERGLSQKARAGQSASSRIEPHLLLPQPTTTLDPPPESVVTIAVCAEKCKGVLANCDDKFQARLGHAPAPKCLWYSETEGEDPYWRNVTATAERNKKTRALVVWGGRQARRRGGHLDSCEDRFTSTHISPMMFPEEFEMVVKTLAQHRPATYLEWGSGKSTSFYPLLASGKVAVIDGYPPWCVKVEMDTVVKCLIESGRLSLACKSPVRADGTEVELLGEGRLPSNLSDADVNVTMETYVNAVDDTGFTTFDAALVDGRFRVACALKLLPYLHSKSILFMHDFWLRPMYHAVLPYYDVLGTARSLVVLRKKTVLPTDHKTAYLRFMTRKTML